MNYSNTQRSKIIKAINVGNILEWYEMSIYVYWAPTISNIFFNPQSKSSNLINVFAFLALGYAIRPLGGILFGRLGDKIGRKKALIWSVLCMTFSNLIMAFLPSYSTVGAMAPILLCINRLLQSIPAGGELPGSFCFLNECSQTNNKRYFTSWGFVGNQLGIVIAMLECILFETYIPKDNLVNWGWRLSFILGSQIGLLGFYLRKNLQETPVWHKLEKTHKLAKSPILEILSKYKWKIAKGVGYSAITSVSFGALISFFPIYFSKLLGTSYSSNLMITIILLILVTLPLTFFGKLADHYNYKKILILSSVSIILIAIFFYLFNLNLPIKLVFGVLISLSFACLYAILPFLLTDLFPPQIRFTGVGLTFNIADIFEGLTPVAALYLSQITSKDDAYFWILIGCSLISLASYLRIKVNSKMPAS